MGKKKRKYDKGASVGFLMALPTVLGLILLNIYPLCRTVYMSFFKSGAFGKWTFVGLDNYVTMFQSAGFWTVTKNTLLFMLLTVPVTVVLGLLIAVLLNQSINIVLGALHLPSKIQWISDPKTALLACAIVTIWSSVGYDAILLLSGLQSISKSYYEAARIDGANSFQQFKSITIPLVSPTLFFVLMMRVMASLKVFDIVYMMIEKTNPAIRSCETILYNFYQETFVKNNKGYGSALVVWCVILIAIITAVQFIGQKKWVTYDV